MPEALHDIESARRLIAPLVERFARNRDHYRAAGYNEETARNEFIGPFFEALGWDVANRSGSAEQYKDVIHEEGIKVGDYTKAPDYTFRYGGVRKFFVEAKKPIIDVKGDPGPAFQLRRYAWSAKLPLSIVTDFEEFAVFDTRVKPKAGDGASVARILYLRFDEYLDHLEEIWKTFSKEAVRLGSFDRFAEDSKGKKGTSEVDAEFLRQIEEWREVLAKNLATENEELSVDDLNYAVQTTIDRIVFLRIAEGRGVEPYGQLQGLLNGPRIYKRLVELYRRADERYNSGLFDFRADRLTTGLEIDDKILKTMLSDLYYPRSPYEFSVLPAEILGNVYEQFLGKVIRLTKGHRAVVEEKPEVKKAGGVYYTPAYIVQEIVSRTLGAMCEGKSPKQLATVRVLDPACGSGSFLLVAYQFFLDRHLAWYQENDPKKHTKAIYRGPGGGWRLTSAEKRRILLNSIYGVDIDRQAVEVTKLSLLLKVLEGESDQTLRQQALFGERALPSLEANIKCGNSLLGPTDLGGDLFPDADELRRINPFDWKREFPDVMKAGGFDAVIGNPPYIRIQTMQEWAPLEVERYKILYRSAAAGNYDIYVVFVEKGLGLLRPKGRLGFILPHKFFNAKYGEGLRGHLAAGKHLAEVVHFGDQQVFPGATTYTCLLFVSREPSAEVRVSRVGDLAAWRHQSAAIEGQVPASNVTKAEWNFVVGAGTELIAALLQIETKLEDVANLFVGIQTDADDVFILEEVESRRDRLRCRSKATGEEHWFEAAHLRALVKGSVNVRRYELTDLTKRLIFPYDSADPSQLISEAEYRSRFPLTWEYLVANKKRLTARAKGSLGSAWYGYVYKKNHRKMTDAKLLVPSLGTGACFAPDLQGKFFFVGSGGGGGGGYGITLKDPAITHPLALLGILNSSLSTFFLKNVSTAFRGGYLALNRQFIALLPIRLPDRSIANGRQTEARLVALVEQILNSTASARTAKTPHARTALERQSTATDREIDQLCSATIRTAG